MSLELAKSVRGPLVMNRNEMYHVSCSSVTDDTGASRYVE